MSRKSRNKRYRQKIQNNSKKFSEHLEKERLRAKKNRERAKERCSGTAVRSVVSQYRAWCDRTKAFTKDIGLALCSSKDLVKEKKIGSFNGKVISDAEKKSRVSTGDGKYILDIGNGFYLDCYKNALNGKCLMSLCNSSIKLRHVSTGKAAEINCRIGKPVWRKNKFVGISLFVGSKNIKKNKELFCSYSSAYIL
jgi:hypothetical protein